MNAERVLWLLVPGLLYAMVGCAATPQEPASMVSTAVFYPKAPEPPRLQFLTSFSDAKEFAERAKQKQSFSEWLVGEEKLDPSTRFASPYGIAARNGRIYICDVGLNRVHVIDAKKNTYDLLPKEKIGNPVNITLDSDGTKYVCDTGRRVVAVFDGNDQHTADIGDPTSGWNPIDVAIYGGELFVADVTGGVIQVYSKQGEHLRTIGTKGRGPDEMHSPTNLDIGPDGRLYIADTFQQEVKVYDRQGAYQGSIGVPGSELGGFARPKGIVVDPHGSVYVADAQWDHVQVFSRENKVLLVFGEVGDFAHSMGVPAGLAIDKTSIDVFRDNLAPGFEPEYLLFVVNQFGKRKIAVYAYGRDTSLGADAYKIDMTEIERRSKELFGDKKTESGDVKAGE